MSKEVTIPYELYQSFMNMRVIIPKNKWFVVEGETRPCIECPKCGGHLLGDTAPHGVTVDGNVHASVVCGHPRCDFHAHVTLDEWDRGIIPHK